MPLLGNIRTFHFLIGNWSVIFSAASYKNHCISGTKRSWIQAVHVFKEHTGRFPALLKYLVFFHSQCCTTYIHLLLVPCIVLAIALLAKLLPY